MGQKVINGDLNVTGDLKQNGSKVITAPTITITASQVISQDPLNIELTTEQTAIWDAQYAAGLPIYFDLSAFSSLGYHSCLALHDNGDDGFKCEEYTGDNTLIISATSREQEQVILHVFLSLPYPIYPEVTIEQSQVISQDPVQIQLTDAQYNVFLHNKQVFLDLSASSYWSVIWHYAGDDNSMIVFGFDSPDQYAHYYRIIIDKSTKIMEYESGPQGVDYEWVTGASIPEDNGKLLVMDSGSATLTPIKTINNTNLLGSGNISLPTSSEVLLKSKVTLSGTTLTIDLS